MLACATLSSLPPWRGGNEKRTGTGVEKKAFSCDNVPLRLESAYRFGRMAAPDAANRKSRMKRLLELAKERFADDWTDADNNLFQKTIQGEPPVFNTFVYSLDSFIPLIDLHQAKYRLPTGCSLRVYHWLHIGFGWLLTTLLVVGLTGLVRK